MSKTLLIVLLSILVLALPIWLIFKRNYFNKYKYMRLVSYNKDMTITVKYIKHEDFNKDGSILIDPKHVFNFNGYTSIIVTSESSESINPLDFNSKFNAKDFKTAMNSKLIADTFATLKTEKFDKIMFLLVLNIIQLLAIIYLFYNLMGGGASG